MFTVALWPELTSRVHFTGESENLALRSFYNDSALSMIKANPFLGVGIGNFVQSLKLQVTSYKLQEHRPIMHDVIAPKEEAKASVGPIEELQQVTLTDFRRLSSNPTQAGEILLGKFDGLKEESYLLFLKAVQSWYNSPLYKQYQQIIADAINKTVKIKDALGQMKEEEYKAIVKLCNSL